MSSPVVPIVPSLLQNLKLFVIGFVGACLLRAISKTVRWHSVGLEGEKGRWSCGEPGILTFWHGQQLLMPRIYINGGTRKERRRIWALISLHSDGRMISKVLSFMGIDTIPGSTSRGGLKALFSLIDKLREGFHIAITPDGPKGPHHKLSEGVIRIAQRSGALIYPAAMAAEKKWTFRSWDKMFLPKPFTNAVLVMGDPISVPREMTPAEIAERSALVEKALNDLTMVAESYSYKK